MRRVLVASDVDIPHGARVLVRGRRASLAGKSLCNATATPRPPWLHEKRIDAGKSFFVVMDEGTDCLEIKAIANGPIMDSNKLYLPAGKLTMEQFKERQRSIILDDPS